MTLPEILILLDNPPGEVEAEDWDKLEYRSQHLATARCDFADSPPTRMYLLDADKVDAASVALEDAAALKAWARRHLATLEAQLLALPAFQSAAFDNEGDDEVLDAGGDPDAAAAACDRILARYLGHAVGKYIRARYPLSQSWPLSQQIEAVETLIESFSSAAAFPRLPSSFVPVPTGGAATGLGAAGGCSPQLGAAA